MKNILDLVTKGDAYNVSYRFGVGGFGGLGIQDVFQSEDTVKYHLDFLHN